MHRKKSMKKTSRPTANNPANTKHLYNIFDVGPALYKCYAKVLCLLGRDVVGLTLRRRRR